jgi:hypothetical protein
MNRRRFLRQVSGNALGFALASNAGLGTFTGGPLGFHRLSWLPVTRDAVGRAVAGVTYNVYRGLTPNTSIMRRLNVVPLAGTSFGDTDIQPGAIYYYAVSAISGAGIESGKSFLVRAGAV